MAHVTKICSQDEQGGREVSWFPIIIIEMILHQDDSNNSNPLCRFIF